MGVTMQFAGELSGFGAVRLKELSWVSETASNWRGDELDDVQAMSKMDGEMGLGKRQMAGSV